MYINNQRGHIHLMGLVIVILLVIVFGPYLYSKLGGGVSNDFILRNDDDVTPYYRDGNVNKGTDNIDQYINVAVDQHTRLLRIKADAVVIAWNTLDDESKRMIVATFEREIESQQAVIGKFIKDIDSPQWTALSMAKRREKIQSFFDALSLQRFRSKTQTARTNKWVGSK